MKTFQREATYPGWNRAYIDRIWFASIELMLAEPKIHANRFHQPLMKPTNLEYFDPAVTLAQW
jgi:hypothetical protein